MSALRDQTSQRVQTRATLDQTRKYLFRFGQLLTKPEKIVVSAPRDQISQRVQTRATLDQTRKCLHWSGNAVSKLLISEKNETVGNVAGAGTHSIFFGIVSSRWIGGSGHGYNTLLEPAWGSA